MNDWLQPLATSLAGAAAIATVTWTVTRDRHPLAFVERLTSIAKDVRSEQVRMLIEDDRDQRAARWVLERRAPQEAAVRTIAITLFCLGSIGLLLWLAGTFVDRLAVWTWVSYGAGLVLMVAARITWGIRASRRKEWMDQERTWRALPTESIAQRVARLRRNESVSGTD